ncbi:hypothetical protein [Spirosoma radiotolerans]|uniref:Uncharacterized protein n=1 Tax=Spirosoma radiotolerans TaxID=1379870 RepID=A0A0E3V5Q0_9BACT|nr:hypothetical protein [Spirosoma radiotolerans]AKD53821.1 hypothetical protein SD10_01795 [Spirosoma radiotolerans]
MDIRAKREKQYLEERKLQLEYNMATSRQFLNFFESRLPSGYSEQDQTTFKTELQTQFAQSAYSHKQLIAMLETYHQEVMKSLAEYDAKRAGKPGSK